VKKGTKLSWLGRQKKVWNPQCKKKSELERTKKKTNNSSHFSFSKFDNKPITNLPQVKRWLLLRRGGREEKGTHLSLGKRGC